MLTRSTLVIVCIKVTPPRQREKGRGSPTSSYFYRVIHRDATLVSRGSYGDLSDLCSAKKKYARGRSLVSRRVFFFWFETYRKFIFNHIRKFFLLNLEKRFQSASLGEKPIAFLARKNKVRIPPRLALRIREAVGLFWDEKRPRVCLPMPSLREVFRRAETASARFSIRSSEKDDSSKRYDCLYARRADRLSRLVFPPHPNFRVLETPSQTRNPNPPLLFLPVHPTACRLALGQRSVFPRPEKVSSTRRKNIFETTKSP